MKIKWKKVKIFGFEHYLISNDGVLYNTKTNSLTYGFKQRNGTLRFELSNKGTFITIAAHLLVLHHFKRKELDKNYGLHIDGIKINNRINNLKWATLGEIMSATKRRNNEKKGKIRGVYKHTNMSGTTRYRAVLTLGKGKQKTLGYFDKKKDAIMFYKQKYKEMYGVLPF